MAPNVMISDQVIVLVEPEDNNGSPYAPGIVTRVYAGGVISARVFRDLPGEVECARQVQLFDSHDDEVAAQEQFKSNARLANKIPEEQPVKLMHPIAAFLAPARPAATSDTATAGALSGQTPAVPEPDPEPERTPPPAEVTPTF